MREDPGRVGGGGTDVADDIATGAEAARFGDRLVAADVIAVQVRVDDVADRLVADSFLIAASSLSLIVANCVSTTITPSSPT